MKIQKRYKANIFLLKLGSVINGIYGIFFGFICLMGSFVSIFTEPFTALFVFLIGALGSAFFILTGYYGYKVADYALKFLQITTYNKLDKERDYGLNPVKLSE